MTPNTRSKLPRSNPGSNPNRLTVGEACVFCGGSGWKYLNDDCDVGPCDRCDQTGYDPQPKFPAKKK